MKDSFRKFQETLKDATNISSRELKRGLEETKSKISTYRLVQRKKDLFLELGQLIYELYDDSLEEKNLDFSLNTEVIEVLDDIKKIDSSLYEIKQKANDDIQ